MSVADVVKALKVSATRVRKLCRDGLLKSQKIGERVFLIDAKSVADYKTSPSRDFAPKTRGRGRYGYSSSAPPDESKKKQ